VSPAFSVFFPFRNKAYNVSGPLRPAASVRCYLFSYLLADLFSILLDHPLPSVQEVYDVGRCSKPKASAKHWPIKLQ